MLNCYFTTKPKYSELLQCFLKMEFNDTVEIDKVYSNNYEQERFKDLTNSNFIIKNRVKINSEDLEIYQSSGNISRSYCYFIFKYRENLGYFENIKNLPSIDKFMESEYDLYDIASIIFQIFYSSYAYFYPILEDDEDHVKKIPQNSFYLPEFDLFLITKVLYKTNNYNLKTRELVYQILKSHIYKTYGKSEFYETENFWKYKEDKIVSLICSVLGIIYKEDRKIIIKNLNNGLKDKKNYPNDILQKLSHIFGTIGILFENRTSYDRTFTYGKRSLTIIDYYKNNTKTGKIIRKLYQIELPENINKNKIYNYTINEILGLNNVLLRDLNTPNLNYFTSNHRIENYTIDEIFNNIYPIVFKDWENRNEIIDRLYRLKKIFDGLNKEELSRELKIIESYNYRQDWSNPIHNFHVIEQILGYPNQSLYYKCEDNIPFKRYIDFMVPQQKYIRSAMHRKSIKHFGQRKLLISELEFLNIYGHLSKNIIYAGAAPGTHIIILSKFFPTHNFVLYDPSPFNERLRKMGNIELVQEFFTENVCHKLKDLYEDCLFISDIRSPVNYYEGGEIVGEQVLEENSKEIMNNMNSQYVWCKILEPKMASLKFRLGWEKGEIEYFDGKVFLQAWSGNKSSEGRLFTDCKNLKIYNNLIYDSEMYYYNTVMRMALYPREDLEELSDLYDHCYDCTCEINVLSDYIRRNSSNSGIRDLLIKIAEDLSGREDSEYAPIYIKPLSLSDKSNTFKQQRHNKQIYFNRPKISQTNPALSKMFSKYGLKETENNDIFDKLVPKYNKKGLGY